MPDRSPGADSGAKGQEWATQGFTKVTPPDEYVNQTESDQLLDNNTTCHPDEHFKQSKKVQRAGITPEKADP